VNYSDLDGEMREHLNEKVADLMERGLSESEARAQALREFGNRTLHLEDSRAVWRWPSLDRLSSDLRYALRGMRRSRGFTAVVVLTLALGIGANTAIFSLVNQLLLHPSGIANPERIVAVRTRYPKLKLEDIEISPPTLADVRASRDIFEHAAMSVTSDANYTGGDQPERLIGALVTAEWFDVFGVQPLLGRTFRPEEDQPNANRVVVLSYATWQRLFGTDRSIVGRTIRLNDFACQVIGVMNPAFRFPDNTDFWMPLGLPSELYAANNRFSESYFAVALRTPGVTFAQTNAWMGVLTDRVRSTGATWMKNAEWGLFAKPFTDSVAGTTKTPLLVLAAAVGFVLLIACSNIAGLMLARASARAHEFAVRAALGASSSRLLRVILTESALLATAGGAAGLALAYAAMRLLLILAPESASAGLRPDLDIHVLLFCAATVVLSGLLFGIVPAWRISRCDPNQALKSGRSTTADPVRQRLRSALVIAETALALMLLVSAGLFLRSFVRLQSVTPGFNPHGVMTASFTLPVTAYPNGQKQAVFYRALLEKLRAAHGVTAAALADPIPFSGRGGSAGFEIDGWVPGAGEPPPHGDIRAVTPGYFEALSIPLLRGRTFTDQDRITTDRVVIIDDVLARRYWPDQDPIGKKIKSGNLFTIIGVVGHVTHSDLASDSGRGTYYFTMFQRAIPTSSIVVKTNGEAASMAQAIRDSVRAADSHQSIYSVRPMDDLVSASLGPRRFGMRLLSLFGAMALFLAALGLYGVISYSVAQRTREIGIRVALGASTGSVIGQVVTQGLRLAGIGVGIGIVGAILCGRFLASQLFQVTPFDPLTLSAMAAALLTAAFIASYLPALRAARVDPVMALRNE
jgi:predicted permease